LATERIILGIDPGTNIMGFGLIVDKGKKIELIALDVKRISEQRINVTNLRIASITGGTNRLRLELVSKLVMNAIKGEPITVIGGEQVLSYIDVRDVCSGIIALMSIDPNTWKEYYNLGANQQHTIMEIAKIVIDASEKLKLDPVKLKVGRNDIHRIVGMDSSLFYKDTGWSPKHPLEDTVMALFEFFMENPTRNQVKT
jgi:nucleoside-diphosphate-sugar epimerase